MVLLVPMGPNTSQGICPAIVVEASREAGATTAICWRDDVPWGWEVSAKHCSNLVGLRLQHGAARAFIPISGTLASSSHALGNTALACTQDPWTHILIKSAIYNRSEYAKATAKFRQNQQTHLFLIGNFFGNWFSVGKPPINYGEMSCC